MKYSRQREQIIEYVKSVKTHPTAETVYQEIRKQDPNISLGTVYRNLDRLAQDGVILRLQMANQKDRFDGDTSHHYHAVCHKCGIVHDIFVEYFQELDQKVEDCLHAKVLSHEIVFDIICPECNNIEGGL